MTLTNKAVAEALDGLPAHKMHCSVLAEEAIQAALECKQPALIEVVIHEDDKVFPMVSPGAPISDVFDADDLAENK